MNQVLNYLNFDLVSNSLVIQVFLTIFLTLISSAFCVRFIDKLYKKASQNQKSWDNIILISIKQPIRLLIYIVGISFILELLGERLNLKILSAVAEIRVILIVFIAMSFILKLIKNYEEISRDSRLDANSINIITKLLRASVYITSVLILMQSFGINISGLLAFGGVGGLAIGFAAKDLLANFFGAIMIYMDKPFKVGDTIHSPDKDILGSVESIGWRLTVVRNFDQRPVYIPNALFSSIVVVNSSRMTNRKLDEMIGVRYEDIAQVEKIVEDLKANLSSSDLIDQAQSVIVNLHQYGDFSVNIRIYCFTITVDWEQFHEDKQKILLDVANIVASNKADFAFPTQTLHISKEGE
ncbi:MAG: mechanosensitive ion channel family protein [Rickettsiales bacterium]|jgi:MscS family membrane protein|nr:mechanosensitive ion channel family protein [Rickettsiales bacterium]